MIGRLRGRRVAEANGFLIAGKVVIIDEGEDMVLAQYNKSGSIPYEAANMIGRRNIMCLM